MAASALLIAGLLGCGSDQPEAALDPELHQFRDVGINQAAADIVPPELANSGTIAVPMAVGYPPNEFMSPDGEKIIGMDPDLVRAIGQRLGLDLQPRDAVFEGIIDSVVAGENLLAMSSFTVTPERAEAVDMVTYFQAGSGFFAAEQGTNELSGLSGLCGNSVVIPAETVQVDDARRQSRRCEAAGEEAITVRPVTSQEVATESVESGKSDFGVADSPVAAYIVRKSEGRLVKVGEDYGVAPYGILVNRESGLAPAIEAAMNSLIADGSYAEILERWGLEGGAISKSAIEP